LVKDGVVGILTFRPHSCADTAEVFPFCKNANGIYVYNVATKIYNIGQSNVPNFISNIAVYL
jgi:hypothetical protein